MLEILEAFAFRILRWRYRNVTSGWAKPRDWFVTSYRPPGNFQGCESYEFDQKANFSGTLLELDSAGLHRQLDAMIAIAQRDLAEHPERNVWRVGELRLRWRTGHAVERLDFERIGFNPDGSKYQESD